MDSPDPNTTRCVSRTADYPKGTISASRCKPLMNVWDNGTEFTSNAVLHWSKEHQLEWHYIAQGKPMQNG